MAKLPSFASSLAAEISKKNNAKKLFSLSGIESLIAEIKSAQTTEQESNMNETLETLLTLGSESRAAIEEEIMSAILSAQALIDNDGEIDEIDIRLRFHDGSFQVVTGDSSFDHDHRGIWGYASILKGESADEICAELIDGANGILENAAFA